jgi:hypothetical protein
LQSGFVLSQADFERVGVADYEKVFGFKISTRHFRNLITRTRNRDCGREDWDRLEIYLPDKLKRKAAAPAPARTFRLIDDAIASRDKIEVVKGERVVEITREELIWERTLAEYAWLVMAGETPKRAARILRGYLAEREPALAPNRDALLKTFERRLARWIEGENFDKRQANGADDGEITRQIEALGWFIPAARFFYLLTNRTHETGSLPEALRLTVSLPHFPVAWQGGLQAKFLKAIGQAEAPACPADLREAILARQREGKPLVPEKIAAKMRVDKSTVKHFRSPREWSLANQTAPGSQRRFFNSATGQREMMKPGDWFGGDDATPGIAVCVPADGLQTPCSQKFGVLLGRFQWLVFNDCRTDKILAWDYVVRPRGSYRAEDILNGMQATTRTHGIPRQGWQFEGGTFNSNLVKQAIANLGCQHWRTHSPHAKPIESVFNRVWTMLAVQFPHADMGRFRNENEANCKLYEACKAGHKDPRRYFPTLDLVVKAFDEIVGQHNGKKIFSRQYGQWVPDEFFAASVQASPLRPHSADMDWMFAPYSVERTVRGMLVGCKVPMFEGLSVPFEFGADWLPRFSGCKVRLHFNPRQPKCAAKVVLLENCNGRKAGDVLGDAPLVSETASQIRYLLQWGDDDQRAGFIARQKAAHAVRRETRGIGAGGRVEYAKTEERDGLGQIGIIERGAAAPVPAADEQTQSVSRIGANLAEQTRAERSAELEQLRRETEHLFV